LVYAAVKRWFGAGAGLLAGLVLATTPVAALMFRFNNPDAALVVLLTTAAYCMTRAIERAQLRWMLLTGVALGFAFLAKELQALLIVPGLALAYLVAAPATMFRRMQHLVAGLAALVASAGWWLALAVLWPASSRPYFGGSTHNSVLEVILGGNGLSRLTGESEGPGGGGAGMNFSGASGWDRLFNDLMGGQISWLLPAAAVAMVAGLALCWNAQRTNKARAALIIWGGWLSITAVTLSYMQGIVHTYYTVALAPAIAAVIGIVVPRLWSARTRLAYQITLVAMLAASIFWSYELLDRTPQWHPALRVAVVVMGITGIAGLVAEPLLHSRRAARLVATLGIMAALLGPVAYSVQTVSDGYTGSIPSAGPTVSGNGFGGPGAPGGAGMQAGFGGGPSGNAGGNVQSELVDLLRSNASQYTWAAATTGSQSSATLQLAANVPVMSMGGFNGGDPYPTLDQFKQYVAEGRIHYFVSGNSGMGGGPGRTGDNNEITTWVAGNFTAATAGGQTVYDLTSPTA
jgi:4-amino-4-deoxy-L-arabinose transferase-like glycosyltransferase